MYKQALQDLLSAGYLFRVEGNALHYDLDNPGEQDEDWTLQRLNLIRQNKPQVCEILQGTAQPATVAADIETTGLNPRKDTIRLIAIASETGSEVFEDPAQIAALLADACTQKVFHNAAFDVGFLQAKGFVVNNYVDTMVTAQILDQNRGDHSLAGLAAKYLNLALDKTLQSGSFWRSELTPAHREYCRKDAETTLQLFHKLAPLIERQNLNNVLRLEMGALPCIARLQADGVPFDARAWQSDLTHWQKQKDAMAADIQSELCSTLNLASPAQLQTCLQNRGIPLASTRDEELAKWEATFPILTKIRKWRELHKIITSFGNELVSKVESDGRIHPTFRLIGATTGRMSCSTPNIQQIPHILRPYFRTRPGRVFVIADYSQIELRVAAFLSGDETMLKAFLAEEDLHSKTARMILQRDEITKAERQVAKTANFGLIYGMSAWGLKNRVKTEFGLDLSLQEAEHFRHGFFKLYPGVRRWQEKQLLRPLIKTLGGRCWNDLPKVPRSGWRNRLNYAVQGTAAEGLKESLPLLLEKLQPNWQLCALVHDEVVLETPAEEAAAASTILRNCLIRGMEQLIPGIPVKVDVSIYDSWKKD